MLTNGLESCPAPPISEGQIYWRPNKANSGVWILLESDKPLFASGFGSCSLSSSVTLSSDLGILCEVSSLERPWLMALALGSLPTFPKVLAVSPSVGHKTPSALQCLELLGLSVFNK